MKNILFLSLLSLSLYGFNNPSPSKVSVNIFLCNSIQEAFEYTFYHISWIDTVEKKLKELYLKNIITEAQCTKTLPLNLDSIKNNSDINNILKSLTTLRTNFNKFNNRLVNIRHYDEDFTSSKPTFEMQLKAILDDSQKSEREKFFAIQVALKTTTDFFIKQNHAQAEIISICNEMTSQADNNTRIINQGIELLNNSF